MRVRYIRTGVFGCSRLEVGSGSRGLGPGVWSGWGSRLTTIVSVFMQQRMMTPFAMKAIECTATIRSNMTSGEAVYTKIILTRILLAFGNGLCFEFLALSDLMGIRAECAGVVRCPMAW